MLKRPLLLIALSTGLQVGCVPEISPPGASDDTGAFIDADGDGYNSSEDCDDTDSAIFPGATEICDDLDNDCDDEVDEDIPTLYADADGDGFGDPDGETTTACEADGFTPYGVDCDDTDDSIHPGAEDYCDGLDNDCDDLIDEEESATVSQEDADADYTSINDALDAGESCISVGPGTYYETLYLTEEVVISGSEGPDVTIISGYEDSESSVIWIGYGLSNDTVISGLTIQEGTGYRISGTNSSYDYEYTYGGGIYVNSATPILRNLIIKENKGLEYLYDGTLYETSYGGGLYLVPYYEKQAQSVIVEDVELYGNEAVSGADIYVNGQQGCTEIRRTWAHDSYSSQSGGSIYLYYTPTTRTTLLENVVVDAFTSSSTSNGVIYAAYSNVEINNVAVVDSDGHAALWVQGTSSIEAEVTVRNSIFAYNDTTYAIYASDSGTLSTTSVEYSALVEPSTAYASSGAEILGETVFVDEDPQFSSFSQDSDGTNDKLALSKNSPFIDAGDPSSEYNDPDGSRNDIGPYGGPEATW